MDDIVWGAVEGQGWVLEDFIEPFALAPDAFSVSSLDCQSEGNNSQPFYQNDLCNTDIPNIGSFNATRYATPEAIFPAKGSTYPSVGNTDVEITSELQCGEQIYRPAKLNNDQSSGRSQPASPKQEPSKGALSMRRRLTTKAKSLLHEWFRSHVKYPYPSPNETSELAKATTLSPKQIRIFFTNMRARRGRGGSGNKDVVSQQDEHASLSYGAPIEDSKAAELSTGLHIPELLPRAANESRPAQQELPRINESLVSSGKAIAGTLSKRSWPSSFDGWSMTSSLLEPADGSSRKVLSDLCLDSPQSTEFVPHSPRNLELVEIPPHLLDIAGSRLSFCLQRYLQNPDEGAQIVDIQREANTVASRNYLLRMRMSQEWLPGIGAIFAQGERIFVNQSWNERRSDVSSSWGGRESVESCKSIDSVVAAPLPPITMSQEEPPVSPSSYFPSHRNPSYDSFASATFSSASLSSLSNPSCTGSERGRRGKKRYSSIHSSTSPARIDSQTSDQEVKKFYRCTFCRKASQASHGWKRHEATHVQNAQKWICMLEVAAIIDGQCAFCGTLHPDAAHMEAHNVSDCLDRSVPERTFGRKDQLKQHLLICHISSGSKANSEAMAHLDRILPTWFRETDASELSPEALWCGICFVDLPSWLQRVEHVWKHLRDGCDVDLWIKRREVLLLDEK